jgi:hypothetical protein
MTCTPYEAFHNKVHGVHHLRAWGCLVYVHIEKQHTTTLGPKAEAGILVGYEPHEPVSYRVLVNGGRVQTTKKLTFVEGHLMVLHLMI